VVVHEADFPRPGLRPFKANTELVVDAKAVLAGPLAPQRLQMVSRRDLEGDQGDRRVELVQLATRDGPELARAGATCRLGIPAVVDVVCADIRERPNHRARSSGERVAVV